MRIVIHILSDLISEIYCIFLDDLYIKGSTTIYDGEEIKSGLRHFIIEYIQNIDKILINYEFIGVIIVNKKSQWCQESITIVGYICDPEGRRSTEDRMKKIRNWKSYINITELRHFLELINIYRIWIQDLIHRGKSLNKLFRKGELWLWGKEQMTVFDDLRIYLNNNIILIILDYTELGGEIVLMIDISIIG